MRRTIPTHLGTIFVIFCPMGLFGIYLTNTLQIQNSKGSQNTELFCCHEGKYRVMVQLTEGFVLD